MIASVTVSTAGPSAIAGLAHGGASRTTVVSARPITTASSDVQRPARATTSRSALTPPPWNQSTNSRTKQRDRADAEQRLAAGGCASYRRPATRRERAPPSACCAAGTRSSSAPRRPGTGVIAEATSRDRRRSPRRRRRPSSSRFSADVDDDRAGLDPVAPDHPRAADGGDQHVGARGRPPAGRACASGRSSRSRSPAAAAGAIGLPKRFERPITTASAPSSSRADLGEQDHHALRRARPQPLAAERQVARRRSASGRRRPCRGRSGRSASTPSMWSGTGSWQRMPLTVVVGVQPLDQRDHLVLATRRRAARWSKPWMPTSARRLLLAVDVDRAGRRRRRPGSSPGRARARARRRTPRPPAATSARTRAATALPSMIRRCHRAAILRVALRDRRVLGHQLALAAVGGEAHDDHAAGLDARHDASPNAAWMTSSPMRNSAVVRRRSPPPHDIAPRADVRGARLAAPRGHRRALAVDELGRDLVEEAAGQPDRRRRRTRCAGARGSGTGRASRA